MRPAFTALIEVSSGLVARATHKGRTVAADLLKGYGPDTNPDVLWKSTKKWNQAQNIERMYIKKAKAGKLKSSGAGKYIIGGLALSGLAAAGANVLHNRRINK